MTVGHVPRKISKVSPVFIRCGGMIQGRHRRYLADLVQGGLEIPCILTYTIDDILPDSPTYSPTYSLTCLSSSSPSLSGRPVLFRQSY